ncbi:MAG: sugar transferase, partial [Planctomycetota bacterium]
MTLHDATPAAAPAAAPRTAGFYARIGKRAIDLLLVAPALPLALLIGLPIAAWNAFAFRSLRRVFFVQDRVGLGGRTFRMVKFRTMREPRRSAADSWFSGEDTARVTRFGRFLRNAHLDELPQLLNVLRGDMHLVGPRPEMLEVHAWACAEVPGFERRLAVRPGLTGHAQITQGYAAASTECYAQKLLLDLEYTNRLSVRTDLGIVLRTVPWVLHGRGWIGGKGPACTAGSEPTAELTPPIAAAPAAAREPDRERAYADAA